LISWMQHELTSTLSKGAATSAGGFATLQLSERHCAAVG
jgi:hypothetical protein